MVCILIMQTNAISFSSGSFVANSRLPLPNHKIQFECMKTRARHDIQEEDETAATIAKSKRNIVRRKHTLTMAYQNTY